MRREARRGREGALPSSESWVLSPESGQALGACVTSVFWLTFWSLFSD